MAYLEFSRHFRALELPVPEIYCEALDEGAYLEEDLGDTVGEGADPVGAKAHGAAAADAGELADDFVQALGGNHG